MSSRTMHRMRWITALLLIAALLSGAAPSMAVSPGTALQCASVGIYGEMNRVAYGNGEYVGLMGGQLVVSADSDRWSFRTTGTGESLNELLFADGRFTAVGSGGVVMHSRDGRNWTREWAGTHEWLTGLAYGNGTYVAIASSGAVAASRDGAAWMAHSLGRQSLSGVAYGGGQFIVVGSEGIFASADGLTWEQVHREAYARFVDVAYGQGRFAALMGESVLLSDDGRNWTQHLIPEEVRPWLSRLTALAYGSGQFLIVGTDGTIIRSVNGADWERVELDLGGSLFRFNLRAISVANGRFIVTGPAGLVLTSSDGRSWSEQNQGAARDHFMNEMAYGNGRFVAVGNAGLLLSHDGYNWEPCTLGQAYGLRSITFDGSRFLATGWEELPSRDRVGRILTSHDGRSWTMFDPGAKWTLSAITSDGRQMVAVGYGGSIVTSEDGDVWSLAAVATEAELRDVLYADGRFVAVGRDGTLLTSPDGLTWTARESGLYGEITEVLHDGCQYIANASTYWAASHDGETWTSFYKRPSWERVAAGGGWWARTGVLGSLYLSADGSSWSQQPAGLSQMVSLVYGADRFVGLSPGGHVVLAEAPARRPAGCDRSLSDLFPLHEAYRAVHLVVAAGLMQPEPDGTFGPDESLPRAELARILVTIAGDSPSPGAPVKFADLQEHPAAAIGYVQAAIQAGLITGMPGDRFNPDYPASPTDILVGVARAVGLAPLDTQPGEYWVRGDGSEGWFAAALEAGLFGEEALWPLWSDEFSLIRPIRITRGEAAMVLANLLAGRPDAAPAGGLTRAELAKLLVAAMGLEPAPGAPAPFADTDGHWAAVQGYLQAVTEAGVMQGFPGGLFAPDTPVTRAQLVKTVAAAAGLAPAAGGVAPYADLQADLWFAGWVEAAWAERLIGPKARLPIFTGEAFDGDQPATRAEAALLISNWR